MIERNRNTDKDELSRLMNKIKSVESEIVIAKKNGEERRLDKLELSLCNASIPALNDQSLLDDEDAAAQAARDNQEDEDSEENTQE